MKKNKTELSIYQQCMDAVGEHKRVVVDLKEKSVSIGKRMLIDHGKWEGELGLSTTDYEDALGAIATAYKQYKRSSPNEHSDWYKCQFTAVSDKELDDVDLSVALPRQVAGTHLCLLVLMNVLNGSIRWEDFEKPEYWFHRCTDNDLRLLKEWF